MKRKALSGSRADDVAAICVFVVMALLFCLMLGPALDRQFAYEDAQLAAFKASLVIK